MGRKTYMTSYAPEMARKYKTALSNEQIRQISKEIEAEIQQERKNPGILGWECDVKNWIEFADWCEEELARREANNN
jgi:hypothetical protein